MQMGTRRRGSFSTESCRPRAGVSRRRRGIRHRRRARRRTGPARRRRQSYGGFGGNFLHQPRDAEVVSRRMTPSSGASSPTRIFSSVDLPAPLRPTRPIRSPRSISRRDRIEQRQCVPGERDIGKRQEGHKGGLARSGSKLVGWNSQESIFNVQGNQWRTGSSIRFTTSREH